MNNQIPLFYNQNYPVQEPNEFNIIIERLSNRITRLERQIKIIENRLNTLNNGPTFLKNQIDDNDNMYML